MADTPDTYRFPFQMCPQEVPLVDAEAREDSTIALSEALQIVARQAEQIDGLQRRLTNEHFARAARLPPLVRV